MASNRTGIHLCHHQVKSIEKAISSVEISIQKSPEEAPKLMIELDALKAKKEYLLKVRFGARPTRILPLLPSHIH
jgi:hypothetical protein